MCVVVSSGSTFRDAASALFLAWLVLGVETLAWKLSNTLM
jgi:hypothetical protein